MLSEYEQLREARIAQNQQRLKDLGILDDVEQLRALHQPTTTRRLQTSTSRDHQEAHPPAPVRQSARLRRKAGHLLPEDIEEDKENALEADRRREQRALRTQPYIAKPSEVGEDGVEHDELSRHRLKTMSEKALMTRIHKVTTLPKLRSFVRVCEQEGCTELAQEARLRIQERWGDVLDV